MAHADVIIDWLRTTTAGALGIEEAEIDPTDTFSHYGLGSSEIVMILGDLETWLDATFPETLAFDYPTLQALAEHVAANLHRYRRTGGREAEYLAAEDWP